MAPSQEALIDYTNWKGERSWRRIRPIALRFGANEWHPDEQWLLDALDVEKGAERTFAMASVHAWRELPSSPLIH